MTSVRFLPFLALVALCACDAPVASPDDDCRQATAACADGFRCVGADDGVFACVPEDEGEGEGEGEG